MHSASQKSAIRNPHSEIHISFCASVVQRAGDIYALSEAMSNPCFDRISKTNNMMQRYF
jgi:hypothetical protein